MFLPKENNIKKNMLNRKIIEKRIKKITFFIICGIIINLYTPQSLANKTTNEFNNYINNHKYYKLYLKDIIKLIKNNEKKNKPDFLKIKSENIHFFKKLAFLESSNNWKAYNGNYIGKYQFGIMALKQINVWPEVTPAKFKKSPEIFPERMQDSCLVLLLKENKRLLGNYISYYKNKKINNIVINKTSLLAAAHLGGHGNVKKFLRSDGEIIFRDENGTSITKYMRVFQNYNIENI